MVLDRRLRIAVLAIVLGTFRAGVAEGQLAGAAGSSGGIAEVGSPLLTATELERHVTYLAADALAGRRAGTAGAERAARYVVAAFQSSGLEPPSSYPTYLQMFEFPVGVELGSDNRLVLQHGDLRAMVFDPGRDFLPLAGSVADRVVQPVVFAGYGISAPDLGYDDYADLDVSGKIVLVLRFSPEGDDPGSRFGRFLSERYKALIARERGARAILFVSGPATEEIDRLIPFRIDEKPQGMGIVAMSVTQGVGRRIVAVGGGDLAEWQHAIDESRQPHSRLITNAVLNLRADLKPRTRRTHNVIGVVPGLDPKLAHEAVVIGAHYDGLGIGGAGSLDPVPGEIHNGADDNASGVAALLELAQFFAYPTNRPPRSLVFIAFGAEEEGMLGSANYVARPVVPLENSVAMINLDMIGRLEDELIVYGVGSSAEWLKLIEQANANVGLNLKLMSEGYGPSDHAAFYLRQVPVLAMFTGVHDDYHRASDDVERLNMDGIHHISAFGLQLIRDLAEGSDRPVFDPREFEPQQITPAVDVPVVVRLGAVPSPGGPTQPVIVDHVLEGSAADLAGVQSGDRIVRLGQRSIASVYDYVVALRELSSTGEHSMIVERDGERLRIVVDPLAGRQ